jgi:hypothetical protein
MARFCGKCGSPLNDTAAFCGGCGAQVPAASTPPLPPTYTPPPAYTSNVSYPAPPAKQSNTWLKIIIAVVVLICVGSALALAGMYYAAKKVTQKAHQVAAQALGGSSSSPAGGLAGLLGDSPSSDDNPGGFKGDPCRFLSKADVTQAVGLPVIRTEAKDGGCSYIAKGDPADVTAKHAAAMLGGFGADAQTQKTMQKFAGALFAQQEASDKDLAAQAATGEIPVLVVSLTSGNAQMEMKMNRGAFEHIKGSAPFGAGNATAENSGSGDLTGIGDEAYVAGGSMIMVRKGNTAARFMYISCPCNTDNIKPLAQKLASQL